MGAIDSKRAIHSKTLLFNLAVAALAVLVDHVDLLRSYLSDGGYLLLMMFVSAANVWLRSVTTQPVRWQ